MNGDSDETGAKRRIRVYGVGLGKTGTHTLAILFQPHFRSGHEFDAERLAPIYTRYLRGDVDRAEIRSEARRRSRIWGLEVDVAAFLSPLAGELARLYPEARFILTIRDCFTWFAAYLEHLLRDPAPEAFWLEARDAACPRPYHYESQDAPLERAGLPSVRAGFQRWTLGNNAVLSSVPSDRLLVVRTEDLSQSTQEIAAFCGIEAAQLRPAHANASPEPERVLGEVSADHLVRVAEEICAPLMQQLWGANWTDLVQRIGR